MSYSSTWYLVLAGMIHILDEVTSKPWYARSKHPTQLAKVSFDEILDLTADVFSFYNIICRLLSKIPLMT